MLRKLGLDRDVLAQQAVGLWPEVAGPKVAAHCRALVVEEGTLLVVVDSPLWLTQMVYLKPALLRRLCGRVGPGLLRDIRFVCR